MDPPGECLSHTEIWRRLAKAMGYTEPELFASDHEIAADLLDVPMFSEAGVTVDRLRREGFIRHPAAEPTFRPFATTFPTPSGRFEFVSSRAEAEGHGRLPNFRPPLEAVMTSDPSGTPGSLALIAAASDHHINSVFAGTDHTKARTTKPPLTLHPDDAACRFLVDGTTVVVSNGRGSFEAQLETSDRTQPGVALTTKGWWRHGLNNTVLEIDADMARGAIFHDNRVMVASAPA